MRAFLLVCAILLSACGGEQQPPLVATDLIVTRPMPGMKMSAAYLSLTNNSEHPITITRVRSNEFDNAKLHESTIKDGIARMRAIPALEIPPGETVVLQRGGKHVMLMRPRGDIDSVTLEFFNGDELLMAVSASFAARIE